MNTLPVIVVVLCVFALAYRYYSAFLAAKAFALDDRRITPAHAYADGHNFVASPRWVLFGHHFAAIAGAGPLVGPTLAAQFGFAPGLVWIVLGAVLALLAWFVARRFLTTRIRASAAQQQALAAARDEDPRALEARADAAEAAGDLEAALRLRFRAGLLRLDARGAIDFRPSISTIEVRRRLHDDDFDALAATFDDVVYGGRPPAADDLAAARERWPRVIEDAA